MQVRDKLVKAVERLEALKAESTPGDWSAEGVEIHAKGSPMGVVWEMACEGGGLANESDGDLIVTLHRTLTAQLAILNAALNWFDEFYLDAPTYNDGRPMGADRMFLITPWRAAEMLADAILGDGND